MITSILSRVMGSGGGRRGAGRTGMGKGTPGRPGRRGGSGKNAAASRGVKSLLRRAR